MARRTRLTPELIDAIVVDVREGVFPYIAAQAHGVPKSTFFDWLRRGEIEGRQPFSELSARVRQVAASARVQAERTVYKDSPFAWLRYGPGRERLDAPGWTECNKDLHHYLTAEQAMELVDKLASALKKHVTDKDALKQIGEDLQRLVANAGVPPSGAA
jgi:hypothetical protein